MASTKVGVFTALAVLFLAVFYNRSTPQLDYISTQLSPKLSIGARVYLPGSEGHAQGSRRWQEWEKPRFAAIIRVANVHDIEETIKYANEYEKPFLAISGGHGGTKALGMAEGTIGIWMRNLNSVAIDSERNIATVEGGITSGELTRALAAAGKESVTGTCACTGAVAPMLGGGHGWLQGKYGEAVDQLISAELTIANGTTLSVNEEHNPDLFWAIRGAGHNYGIISSYQMRVHDRRERDDWSWKQYVFTKASVADVYAGLNIFVEDARAELTHLSMFTRMPQVDPHHHVLVVLVFWRGSALPAKYSDAMTDLQPVLTQGGTTDIDGLFIVSGMDEQGALCKSGDSFLRSPINWKTYNPAAMEKIYEFMENLPPVFNRSLAVTGGFSPVARRSVPIDSTALPDRDNTILLSPFFIYQPGSKDLDDQAVDYVNTMRDIYVKGLTAEHPVNSYVNYASGFESQEDVYGHEPWRLDKLRRLKREFDPFERFSFYVPVTMH